LVAKAGDIEHVEAEAIPKLDLAVQVLKVGEVLAVDLGKIAVVLFVKDLRGSGSKCGC
jgi:hypothetical protein